VAGLQGEQIRLLDQIAGVGLTTREPSRELVDGIEQAKRLLLEGGLLRLGQGRLPVAACCRDARPL
jgi:hypothetical protein